MKKSKVQSQSHLTPSAATQVIHMTRSHVGAYKHLQEITARQVLKLWSQQQGLCAVSGLPMNALYPQRIGVDVINRWNQNPKNNFRLTLLPIAVTRCADIFPRHKFAKYDLYMRRSMFDHVARSITEHLMEPLNKKMEECLVEINAAPEFGAKNVAFTGQIIEVQLILKIQDWTANRSVWSGTGTRREVMRAWLEDGSRICFSPKHLQPKRGYLDISNPGTDFITELCNIAKENYDKLMYELLKDYADLKDYASR